MSMSAFPSTSETSDTSESNAQMQELNRLMACLSSPSKAGDSPPVSSQPRRRFFKTRPEKSKPPFRSKEELHQIYGRLQHPASAASSKPFRSLEPCRKGPDPPALLKRSKEPKEWFSGKRMKIQNPDLENKEKKEKDSYSPLDWSISSSERSKDPEDLPKDLFSKVVFVDEGLLHPDKYSLLRRGGAVRQRTMGPDVTHYVICKGHDKHKLKNAKCWHSNTVQFVRPVWILECIQEGRVLEAPELPESSSDEESTDELEDPDPVGPRVPFYPPYVPFPARTAQTVPEVLEPLHKTVDRERKDPQKNSDADFKSLKKAKAVCADQSKWKSKLESLRQGVFKKDLDSKSKGPIPDPDPEPKLPGEVGLSNFGNTCFMNAGLQCLLNTPPLIKLFVEKQAERKVKERRDSSGIVESLQNVFSSYWDPNPKKVRTELKDFVQNMRAVYQDFDDFRQHDCHEFLLGLLNTLDEKIKKASGSERSRVSQIINKCFQFMMQNEVLCSKCQIVKKEHEYFYSVPLSFPPASEEDPDVKSMSYSANVSHRIEELLEYFVKIENLDSQNYPECSSCGTKQAATKCQEFVSLPNYLIIHLKRFAYIDGRITKLRHPVKFPIWTALDMRGFIHSEYPKGNSNFKLYGCVCHSGGVSAGHYTAYAKNSQTSKWHFFNDENVTCKEPDESVFTSAYILFYAKTHA